MSTSMDLQAVLFSSDSQVIQTVIGGLSQIDLQTHVSGDASSVVEYMGRRKVDAVIVDGETDAPLKILRAMRANPYNKRSVGMALVPTGTKGAAELSLAQFTVEKPLCPTRFNQTLRVAYGLMMGERKRYYRHVIELPVTVMKGEGQQCHAVTVNVSENGMAFRADVPFAQRDTLELEFTLPSRTRSLKCAAEVVWADSKGLCGVRFTSARDHNSDELSQWIADEFAHQMGRNIDEHQLVPEGHS